MPAHRMLLSLLVCVLVLTPFSGHAGADGVLPGMSRDALVDRLREGGLVIYFRHADTGPAVPDGPGVDLARCESQRNLNDKGREEARRIGEQFMRLKIPVGRVLSSEYCRCWQTAQLMFGRYERTPTLTGVSRNADAEQARQRAMQGLRRLLSTAPEPGTNTVLVSHGFNLLDLEGFHLGTQGEAAIFRTLPEGGYRLVARLRPEEWGLL